MTTVVRNRLPQPIELHLPERTLMLPPYGDAKLTETEAASPQVRHLCHLEHIGLHRESAPAPAGDTSSPKPKSSPARKPNKQHQRKDRS